MTNHPNRNKSLAAFTQASHINADLIRAVVKQCGGWQSFKSMAKDVTEHGADGGFSGFIYYTETVKFANNNKAAIVELARNMAEELGESGAVALVAGFVCLKASDVTVADIKAALMSLKAERDVNDLVFNALAWFALEEVSRSYANMLESAQS